MDMLLKPILSLYEAVLVPLLSPIFKLVELIMQPFGGSVFGDNDAVAASLQGDP